MLIFPAIDLSGGQVVRLTRGDYGQVTVYGDDPLAVAKGFKAEGATHLHVVDLDGAKDGSQANFAIIAAIAAHSGLFVEVGGGGRDADRVARYMDLGVGRVIVGTLAVENPDLVTDLAARYPGRLAVGVDAKDGFVAIRGWREVTNLNAAQFMAALPGQGIHTAIYTDIARDGMLSGPNFDAYRALSAIEGLHIIASGGVSTEADVAALTAMNLYGCIIGKALYAGTLTLPRALALAKGGTP